MLRAALSSIVVLALGIAPAAQEGHPLAGTWYGDYGTGRQKTDLTIVMKWDGRAISGTINPGRCRPARMAAMMDITPASPRRRAGLHNRHPAQVPRALRGRPARRRRGKSRIVFEGDIQNPVAGNRRIEGTWPRGAEKGTFQIRRL